MRNSCASCCVREANCSPTWVQNWWTNSCGEHELHWPLHSTRSSACVALHSCSSAARPPSTCAFHLGVSCTPRGGEDLDRAELHRRGGAQEVSEEGAEAGAVRERLHDGVDVAGVPQVGEPGGAADERRVRALRVRDLAVARRAAERPALRLPNLLAQRAEARGLVVEEPVVYARVEAA
ncbi:hypothetical protein AB1Y20_000823 [Prymnesium parvum]|uniref:Uncharacterized protein n=1 Tax=Prymnesium parvum TaxID=97485 RepID=A0AB34K6Z9_PRYPA